MSKSTQQENGEERIAAKSKPMRYLVSRSRAGSSTVSISTATASPGSLRSNSHILDLIAGAGQPVALCRTSESNEGDKIWNSQEWQTDAISITCTGPPVVWDSVIDVDLETTREYNISAESDSFMERVQILMNRRPGRHDGRH